MQNLWSKLKHVRPKFKILNNEEFKSIADKVAKARNELTIVQKQLQVQYSNSLRELESTTLQNLEKWSLIEESVIRQKSRSIWLKLGNSNTKHFNVVIKERTQQKQITQLKALSGQMLSGSEEIKRAKEQQAQSSSQEANNASWHSQYSPSVISTPSSSRPATPSSSSSSSFNAQSPTNRPSSVSHDSPAETAGIIAALRNKSINELKKLVTDKDVYHNFLISLEAVKTQDSVRDELRNETLLLARENLEKEPWIMDLRNQCRIICTTELAAAQEKMHELERRKEELLKLYSPVSLLHQLQDAMKKTEEESEALLGQLLDREIDLTTFVQKSKKLGCSYHKRALTHLAAKAYLAA
ncbi:Vacuolar protein-sorting-associated protein 37 -like protein 2 [Capsicum baccatum]|uniref:Vacuolar protein-sorting-associated protein 37-like protein 2 n=1 Tax=Capsicum baccatum TaxID=33114 RepID=A0A2G2VU17_CAPBA|nr:Vacuolar protein-sorting-associated protein 37 -like protein 2 [Capsicum baccatum]